VNALDVLRALEREPETGEAFLAEVRLAAGGDARLDEATARLERELGAPDEAGARRLLESLATALQASLLVRHAPAGVADAFCASRLDAPGGVFGTLPRGVDLAAIVARSTPRLDG
jgi:putative acyl-CoA dehydrogenase